jgi:predicted deacylase
MKKHEQRVRYSFLKILTGSDLSRRRLPFMSVDSGTEGPAVWLTACGHGDEVGGIVVIQELFRKLRRKPLLKGAVHAFPLMNPLGFETTSRQVTLSKEDLNRSFPGSATGSLAERIAHKIFETILETRPTLVLDLHNDWINSIPYTLLDPEPGQEHKRAHGRATRCAQHAGFPIVRDTEKLRTTLSFSLLRRDIASLTIELGESYIVNEQNIEYGVRSVWSILSHLGMVEAATEAFRYPLPEAVAGRILDYSDKPLSSTSGIVRFLAKPGDVVAKGQAIAKVYNAFGKLQETMTAARDGIVLGHSDSAVAFPGMPMMAFGIIDTQASAQRV